MCMIFSARCIMCFFMLCCAKLFGCTGLIDCSQTQPVAIGPLLILLYTLCMYLDHRCTLGACSMLHSAGWSTRQHAIDFLSFSCGTLICVGWSVNPYVHHAIGTRLDQAWLQRSTARGVVLASTRLDQVALILCLHHLVSHQLGGVMRVLAAHQWQCGHHNAVLVFMMGQQGAARASDFYLRWEM